MECEKCNYWNSSLGICTDREEFINNDGESVCRYHHEATLRPAYQSEWIRVEDRLPEDGQFVLSFGCEVYVLEYRQKLWWDCDEPINKITHWMPLPEPPK